MQDQACSPSLQDVVKAAEIRNIPISQEEAQILLEKAAVKIRQTVCFVIQDIISEEIEQFMIDQEDTQLV